MHSTDCTADQKKKEKDKHLYKDSLTRLDQKKKKKEEKKNKKNKKKKTTTT